MNIFRVIMDTPDKHCMDMELRGLLKALLTVIASPKMSYFNFGYCVYRDPLIRITCSVKGKLETENIQVENLRVELTSKKGIYPERDIRVFQIDHEGWVAIYRPGRWENYVQEKLYPEARDQVQTNEFAEYATPSYFTPIDDYCMFLPSQ